MLQLLYPWGKSPRTHQIGGWVGKDKISCLLGTKPRFISSLAYSLVIIPTRLSLLHNYYVFILIL
jgi:hypothetical protein